MDPGDSGDSRESGDSRDLGDPRDSGNPGDSKDSWKPGDSGAQVTLGTLVTKLKTEQNVCLKGPQPSAGARRRGMLHPKLLVFNILSSIYSCNSTCCNISNSSYCFSNCISYKSCNNCNYWNSCNSCMMCNS